MRIIEIIHLAADMRVDNIEKSRTMRSGHYLNRN